MWTNVNVIFDVVSIVEVWCWIHRTNANGINMQIILQIIQLVMDAFVTYTTKYNTKNKFIQKQL